MTRLVLPLIAVFVVHATAHGGDVDYVREIKPILTARCYPCHGALKQKAGLRVDTVKSMKAGGDSGAAIFAKNAKESPLVLRISATGEERMPPPSDGEHLGKSEIALIRSWIDQGAVGPVDEKPEADAREHWSFRAPQKPVVPTVRNQQWARNPVDAFLAREHERQGLTPQQPVDRRLLLRRVYLDLTGLPPSREEVEGFLNNDSASAYDKVVNKLLNSPQYGERWGRHWMDIWRYSDWWGLGAEVRNSQKHIWHWRDWIVESLNADKGYDAMVREMLAADELYPTDPKKLRATGYLARSYFKFNRNSWLEEVVEHTAKGFLGLTMNCARCHDHKYDPISQQDYYRFRAFFEPYQIRTDVTGSEVNFEKNGIPRVFDCNLQAPTYLFVRGDEKYPKKSPIAPGLPAMLSQSPLQITPVQLPVEGYYPHLRVDILSTHLAEGQQQITKAQALVDNARHQLSRVETKSADKSQVELARLNLVLAEKSLATGQLKLNAIRSSVAADRARAGNSLSPNVKQLVQVAARDEKLVVVAVAEETVARVERDLATANAKSKAQQEKNLTAARERLKGAKLALAKVGDTYTSLRGSLKTLESNLETEESRSRPFPSTSTGRRSALAGWITRVDNPLTARVAVNHIWMRHFGTPLVPTVFDLGRKGGKPTHQELLDWLALELCENGWSQKHIHRLLVSSNAYQMSSASAALIGNRKIDAENRYYWRMNSQRMQAQVIRDNLLSLSGILETTLGGPPVAANAETNRRSLYFFHSHNEQQKFLEVFDDASVLECYRRAESVLPQQALALQNSRLALQSAERIAVRLHSAATSDAEFIRRAFELLLGQQPDQTEQQECASALSELHELAVREIRPDPALYARASLIHALLNHNDFVTIR